MVTSLVSPPAIDDPFATFAEWSSDADTQAYVGLCLATAEPLQKSGANIYARMGCANVADVLLASAGPDGFTPPRTDHRPTGRAA